MGEPCLIRDLTFADVGVVAEIEADVFGDPWSHRSFEELLRSPKEAIALGAIHRKTVIGYLIARAVAGSAEIMNLAVARGFRRRGIAQALLEVGLARLQASGAGEVFLEVRESNRWALVLYERNGFRIVGMRSAYYSRPKEDALVLRRELEPAE